MVQPAGRPPPGGSVRTRTTPGSVESRRGPEWHRDRRKAGTKKVDPPPPRPGDATLDRAAVQLDESAGRWPARGPVRRRRLVRSASNARTHRRSIACSSGGDSRTRVADRHGHPAVRDDPSAERDPPVSVNLTALPMRLRATWRSRVRSPDTQGPEAGRSRLPGEALLEGHLLARRPLTPARTSARSSGCADEPELPGLAAGQVQHVADEAAQVLGAGRAIRSRSARAARESPPDSRASRRTMSLRPDDDAQRRPQLVADHRQEAALERGCASSASRRPSTASR